MTGNEDLTVQFGEDPPWYDLPPVDREPDATEINSANTAVSGAKRTEHGMVRQEVSMATIEIEGKKYKVTETLPYCQAGMPAKFVETPDGERVAVKRGGVWTWWTAKDRLQPRGRCVGMSNPRLTLDAPSAHERSEKTP